MEIRQAEFVSSVAIVRDLPKENLPEFAFIGRSNVGKSSLINMLTNKKGLAKVSNTPGKTQTINHFRINNAWFLVDLPGYGYASVSKGLKRGFGKIIDNYVLKSKNLHCLFVLVDIRLEPQKIDLSFIEWAGLHEIPLAIIYTKCDKLSTNKILQQRKHYEKELLKYWEELPPTLLTSSTSKQGREELLTFIETALPAQPKK